MKIPDSGGQRSKTYTKGELNEPNLSWQEGYACRDVKDVKFKLENQQKLRVVSQTTAGWGEFVTTCCEVLLRRHDLTINTNDDQTIRTFEDRTHAFQVHRRPASLEDLTRISIGRSFNRRIVNFNVKGRRGTGAQVYPAVQYGFTPQPLIVETGDLLHFQWVGSDANPTGNQGNGKNGGDRSNICAVDTT